VEGLGDSGGARIRLWALQGEGQVVLAMRRHEKEGLKEVKGAVIWSLSVKDK
jgi:2-keto-3-deoxy-galactonokinase